MSVLETKERPALKVINLGLRLFCRQGMFGRKTFSHWAVKDVSFEVRKGEVFGIIGRNGAGKTSLLRVLSHIFKPDRGQVKMYGNKLSLLTLDTGFLKELTGRENVILTGMLMGKTRREMQEMMPAIAEFSEIGQWLDQPVSTYSAGTAARLGFSVAINVNADIILIDEAMSVGDRPFRAKSQQKIMELLSSDKTVILVSHNAGRIEELTNRSVWIEKGQSVMYGDSKDISAAYQEFTDLLGERSQDPENYPSEETLLQTVLEKHGNKKFDNIE